MSIACKKYTTAPPSGTDKPFHTGEVVYVSDYQTEGYYTSIDESGTTYSGYLWTQYKVGDFITVQFN
ncbi:MAG: hypothetical protein DRI86_08055 [Bacteroidetes bacterium]|nr:MAG: hypothetical protein DRI86_08055 [Bacteroidota bacterium]